jgi:hypothetical protein
MTDEGTGAERHRAAFAGIVLLLRQLAHQLLESGKSMEARGLIDGLEAIQDKTSGNLVAEEAKFLEDVLYELRLAVVKGPAAPAPDPTDDAPKPGAE